MSGGGAVPRSIFAQVRRSGNVKPRDSSHCAKFAGAANGFA